MDIFKAKKIYMIGIKGVGMTMLAQFLAGKGYEVSGSDTEEKFMTDEVLAKAGIKVIEGFSENNIPKEADLIIYSTSYNENTNAELKKALAGKIKILKYAEALGEVFNKYYGIAVAGAHGKTTTTAWLGYVLEKSGLSPSVLVGARVPQFDGASLIGKSDYLVVETDEYQNKLKYFNPKMVLLNNIEYDHPDFFPTMDDYQQVFIDFIAKPPKSGFLVANFDDKIIQKIANVNCRAKVISYAIKEAADYVAFDIKNENGKQYFKVKLGVDDEMDLKETEFPAGNSVSGDLEAREDMLGDFVISLGGKHNIYNALAVIASCVELGVDLVDIRTHLEEFTGTARRMQVLGEYRGGIIIDDYAHHPTEIKATLEAVKQKYPKNKIRVVFHPHTYTRTKALLEDFSQSFDLADEVIVLDIYGSVREKQGGVHSRDLVDSIINYQLSIKNEKIVKHIPTLKEVEDYLRENIERDDVVVLMGAGDVFRIGENLVS
jgi:UDP-N-acetylmuramate--alanine ligase